MSEWISWLPTLLHGLATSLLLTLSGALLGFPLALILALLASAPSRVVRTAVTVVVDVGRGLPALVILYIVYFGGPAVELVLSRFLSATVAFGYVTAAYSSEIIRASIAAVPRGHVEASDALALSPRSRLWYVVLPQAAYIAAPALLGQLILLFQGTALAFTIAVQELFGSAYGLAAGNFRYLSVLTLCGLIYLMLIVPTSMAVDRMERRISQRLL